MAIKMILSALILSRLDYCNSLYAGCTQSTLQYVVYSVSRIVQPD